MVYTLGMRILLYALSFLLYAIAAGLPQRLKSTISAMVVLAWLVHAAVLGTDYDTAGNLRLGFGMMLSATLWLSVAAYWLENRNLELDGLRVLVLPSAAIASLLPAVFPGVLVNMEGKSVYFSWHIAIAMLAYSTLTVAAFHAVLMALQDTRLHRRQGLPASHWMGAAIDRLPAVLTMEKLLFRMIAFGFVLLTLTMLSGIVFSEQLFGIAFRFDHKTVFTILSWLLFGALLVGRRWRGWRGKTALVFTLSGFVTLLLAYVGTRFVFEVLLHRGFV